MTSIDSHIRAVLDWVAARHPERESEPTPTTPLVEQGWLSSLDVLDLLLFLEERTGRPPALERLAPGALRDARTLVHALVLDGEAA